MGYRALLKKMLPASFGSPGSWLTAQKKPDRWSLPDAKKYQKPEARKYCRIKVKRRLISTAPKACRAFQGWRYFAAENAPPDLSKGDTGDMPAEMAADLKRLGLL